MPEKSRDSSCLARRCVLQLNRVRQLHHSLDFLCQIRCAVRFVEEVEIVECLFPIEVTRRQKNLNIGIVILNEASKINATQISRHANVGEHKRYIPLSLLQDS